MRRRRLFTLCSALSLLMCVAVCVLWVRGYGLADQLVWQRADGALWGHSAPGRIVLGRWQAGRSDVPLRGDQVGLKYTRDGVGFAGNYLLFLNGEPGDTDISWERDGFAWYEKRETSGQINAQWVAPFWFIALAAAALPLSWTATQWRSRIQERRRKNIGLCPACGYDLRASPDRCPECGRPARNAVKNIGSSVI
jgi:hypothetical protein